MESIQNIKQRFEIIGNDLKLNRAIEKAMQVAPTDISVLITGESGVGKEAMPKIIHALSHRKHGKYIAVNCGAIPEGTIDSELFGHEKGSFTGALNTREGYFEVADGGTIFLDEVGELPLTTQVRLLRVLENGEFIKVGSSKIQKTNVRIVAATNVKMKEAIAKGRFREDLYYRLSTIEIGLPPLRDRHADIHLLFRKFAADFATKYKMPAIKLTDEAVLYLERNRWNGNIRQLRNIAEQLSVLETNRLITGETMKQYLPVDYHQLPTVKNSVNDSEFGPTNDILFKLILDMKNEMNDLKKLTIDLLQKGSIAPTEQHQALLQKVFGNQELPIDETAHYDPKPFKPSEPITTFDDDDDYYIAEAIEEKETLNLEAKEIELIQKSLEKHKGKRKMVADELGISERTLYRKIKQYDL
jgi:transcriptional regulator with PAS, ATPase and Fis domain